MNSKKKYNNNFEMWMDLTIFKIQGQKVCINCYIKIEKWLKCEVCV
jgi:hypothetical protein